MQSSHVTESDNNNNNIVVIKYYSGRDGGKGEKGGHRRTEKFAIHHVFFAIAIIVKHLQYNAKQYNISTKSIAGHRRYFVVDYYQFSIKPTQQFSD